MRLGEDSKASCEGLLNENECLNALKTMEANKSPGSDGFPTEFYKVLWSDIPPFLVNAINCSFQKGLLSVTQRQCISLLNCDYKIASKAIGNRIKLVLPKVINGDQSGFLKGRSTAEDIFLIDGIINYAGN